jgi:hypothetical protein
MGSTSEDDKYQVLGIALMLSLVQSLIPGTGLAFVPSESQLVPGWLKRRR